MKKIIIISGISIFILACFIAFLILSKETTDDEEIVESKEKYVAAKSGLNLRSGANKSSKVITLIPFGAMVTIEKSEDDEIFLDGRYGKWVNVKHGNKTGWVFSGFLCDFKPDTAIKPVADYYREQNKKNYERSRVQTEYHQYGLEYLVYFKDSAVLIEEVFGNYIVLEVPMETDALDRVYVIWRYDVKQKKFFDCDLFTDREYYFFYLDNDKYPDLLLRYGGNGASAISILLGSGKGFKNVFNSWGDNGSSYLFDFDIGSCGDMKIVCENYTETKIFNITLTSSRTKNYFRFNCDKRKFEKYAENIMVDSKGIITSIDLKNRSIVVNDNKDSKDVLVKIPANYASYYVERLKKLKAGDEVSLSYEIVDDKKVVYVIDGCWIYESFYIRNNAISIK